MIIFHLHVIRSSRHLKFAIFFSILSLFIVIIYFASFFLYLVYQLLTYDLIYHQF